MSHFVFPSIFSTPTFSITSNLQLITFRFYPLTGVDEAGIQAAQDAGLKCSILAPKGFRMHREQGIELEGRSMFVKRFREEVPNDSE